MKRILFFIVLTIQFSIVLAQSDTVLMRINGKPVSLGEFVYHYNKNKSADAIEKKSVKEYAEMFVNYKLKVEAALDACLDTTTAFRNEFRSYRNMQIMPLLVPKPQMEYECQSYYNRMLESMGDRDIIQPAHIFLRVEQGATAEETQAVKARIDSIYHLLQSGKDFAQLAATLSQDKASAKNGGTLPWMGPNQTLKEFEDVAYSLQMGQVSEPFLSPVGYHIVRLMGRKPLEKYEELRPRIQQYLESRGLAKRLAEQVIDSLAANNVGKSVEEIIEQETTRLVEQDANLRYLIHEYHDGLLLYAICEQEVWADLAQDSVGIATYFKKNKKHYAWKKPHYRGMVYYCKDKAQVKAVAKAVKRLSLAQWATKVNSQFNVDSLTVKTDVRLFEQGDNRDVDCLGLKVKCTPKPTTDGFPYVGVVGKRLKKGPEEWTDVSAQVMADYQRAKGDEFAATLRKKYEVEIYEDVLMLVNSH